MRVARIRNAHPAAESIARAISSVGGVLAVIANPITGSIVINYDPSAICQAVLLAELAPLVGPIEPAPARAPSTRHDGRVGRRVAAFVIESALEAAIQRAILALV